jgi:photosystem II stability/assembly factor-like uncharacterized protein
MADPTTLQAGRRGRRRRIAVIAAVVAVLAGAVSPTVARAPSMPRVPSVDAASVANDWPAAPAGQWAPIGPDHMLGPVVDAGQYHAVGRLTTMAVDPRDPNVIYVGSPGAGGDEGSGVWKTTDGGTSWRPIADDLPTLAVNAIALDPSDPDRVYVVLFHYGLYRSDNAGSNWARVYGGDLHVRTNIGPDADRSVLLVDPTDPQRLYLTSDLGVLRSDDGGQGWTVSLGAGGAMSLVMDPTHPAVLYAAMSSPASIVGFDPYRTQGVYKTDTRGDRWDLVTQLPSGSLPWRNTLLAISHPASDAHETVYALFPRGPVLNNDLFKGIGYDLWRMTDGTWSKQFTCNPDLRFDGSYYTCNFAIMGADPLEPNRVYLGGVVFWTSVDSGAPGSFTRVPSVPPPPEPSHDNIQPYAPHVDYWELAFKPGDPKVLYVVSDGGFYVSDDFGSDGSWTFKGIGITNAEMHDLALAEIPDQPSRVVRVSAGTTDNGTMLSDGTLDWSQFAGGDGGAVAIDPIDTNRLYLSFNDGGVFQCMYPCVGGPRPFLTKLENVYLGCAAYDQTFQLLIYPSQAPVSQPVLDACVSLWRTTEPDSDGHWTQIFPPPSGPSPLANNERVVRVAVDPTRDLYYVGTTLGRVFGSVHGDTWSGALFAHPDSLKVSDIEVDRAHPDTIYASFAPAILPDRDCFLNAGNSRIYRLERTSPDPSVLTLTSIDITGDFPTAPGGEKRCVNAIAIDPHIPRTVYAATDKGMYRGRGNATGGPWVWEPYDHGMPPADVRDLEVDRGAGQLYAATAGRGAFRVTLETILPVSIDIKPGTSENPINIKTGGKIPVAILSSVTFDAPTAVDKGSLRFGRTGTEASLAQCGAAQDVNGDGLLDLVCQFHASLTGFQVGDTVGHLTGLTLEGVQIEGSDAVRILKP